MQGQCATKPQYIMIAHAWAMCIEQLMNVYKGPLAQSILIHVCLFSWLTFSYRYTYFISSYRWSSRQLEKNRGKSQHGRYYFLKLGRGEHFHNNFNLEISRFQWTDFIKYLRIGKFWVCQKWQRFFEHSTQAMPQ